MSESEGRGWWTFPRWIGLAGNRASRWVLRRSTKGMDPEVVLELAEDALARSIRVFGPDGGPTAGGRAQVAEQLERMDRYSEARLLREEVLAADRRNLGAEHQYTLNAELDLAVNLTNSGSPEEASLLCSHVIQVRESVLGPEHAETLSAKRLLTDIQR
jgi:Tetratricopeptide repeat